ncbi:zinc-binding dehydrogenase [Pseudomonas chlororaphis]|uniref:zinc-binding dehydrogenase n=1 Tax=Pseudomonas chlororaphis TaxID=587753 RepID=UPI0021551D93|nr:zinc-binding dehydrogenase [Pseudomonas chlororaphis]
MSPSMLAIEIQRSGGPEVLQMVRRPIPEPGPREVLVRLRAAGVNGKGVYAPPPGASNVPGLEIAGQIVAGGSAVTCYAVGDSVCALIPGGGYAEYTVADERTTHAHSPGPDPERGGRSARGLHDGLVQPVPARQLQGRRKRTDPRWRFRQEDFAEVMMQATDDKGVDVIVDIIAGDYVARNFAAAATYGGIVQIGVHKGAARELSRFPLLSKRLTLVGSTLRSRSHDEKAEIVAELERQVWPLISADRVKPYIFERFALEDVQQAHRLIDSGRHIGKIILQLFTRG